ncbi:DEAD/DEAH box helicase [Pallidibacillus thermolactis]|uniref:DEAD/DEAH box helicase n=1 Tax=Pallidibacillus thermolactis TaxID=251051 RepID=UPI002E1E081D|nr:DEAD/DEAH box helicase [Pallidibacillus thermolactis]MED1672251.1 DEAD/DEAH box helicase [Pallidibacillus thermolactis subsp. kokeshiiformis]
MSTFELLSKNVQKKIWDMRWEEFTPIQDMAIPAIIKSDSDIIISSGTASGKTEAAFLPIITMIEKEAEKYLKVIYISPLKALINNQFERIISLCEYTNIPIHRWHGDVSHSQKKKFIQNPTGILQITPESIESLFINRTEYLVSFFQHVDFIVIDEIHSFLDSERGVHLRSLLSRMEPYTKKSPRIIGLSATIDNFPLVKKWVNHSDPESVQIIESPGNDKDLLYSLIHFTADENNKKPLELYEDIRLLTKEQKALIFCNRRGEVEETTVMLNRLAAKEGIEETYYAHHSSIDKKEREYVEKRMAESTVPKSVVATSSLELGIDVGSIDLVIQLDSTFTVSALKQRLGRSGRQRDANQILQLYSTNIDSFLQSLAVMELIREKWVEPAKGYPKPYDILFHQIISICKETNGVTLENLLLRISQINIFSELEEEKILLLIDHMLETEILEKIQGSTELIVGLEGERIMRNRHFYSVFMTPEMYEVVAEKKTIGKLDKVMFLNVGDNIILAGRLWKISEIDMKRNKIYVQKAVDGNPPKYTGGDVKIHKRIPEKVMEILCSNQTFTYLNEEAADLIEDLRRPYQNNQVQLTERIIWKDKEEMFFETFTGTTIVKTLVWMLRAMGIDVRTPDGLGRVKLPSSVNIFDKLTQIKNKNWDMREIIAVTKENEFFVSKYSKYLPQEIQLEMHASHEIDINGVKAFLNNYNFRVIEN